jgi:hypothetical protein
MKTSHCNTQLITQSSKQQPIIQTSRRNFIKKTLKNTAGAYIGMAMLDAFTGPDLNIGGMPMAAASVAATSW